MARYAAKLLFDWHPDPATGNRVVRLTEERIVVFPARSPSASVERAKRLGKQAELRYDSGHRLRFVGILQLMKLGFECAPGAHSEEGHPNAEQHRQTRETARGEGEALQRVTHDGRRW